MSKHLNSYERWNLFLTFLIVLVTAVYAFFAFCQYHTMSGQLEEMKRTSEATQITANATKLAADIGANTIKLDEMNIKLTERNINAAQKQFMLDQRAWINVGKPRLREPFDPSKIIIIDFETKNSGKTPAKNVKFRHRMWMQYLGKNIHEYKGPFSNGVPYGAGAERQVAVYTDKAIPQEDINLLKDQKEFLFVEIEFIYFDIYDTKKPHHTCICAFYTPKFPTGMALCEGGVGCSNMD